FDTVEANHVLGFKADCRDFSMAASIVRELGLKKVRLLTNNPHKCRALLDAGIDVVAQIPCETVPTPYSMAYLQTKKEKMGHVLKFRDQEASIYIDDAKFSEESPFASIESAIRELKAGRMIVVIDDEDRENEGDLTMAAEMITPEAINFMATHGKGLICLA